MSRTARTLRRLGTSLVLATGLVVATSAAASAAGGGPPDSPPVVTVPGHLVVEATSAFGTLVPYTATATDDVRVVRFSCDHPATRPFFLTTTTVTCTARDSAHQTTSRSFEVTVRDTTAPTLTLPGPVTAAATGPRGAVVTFPTPTADDAVDGRYAAFCDHVPGERYPIGTTTVHCLAYDGSGNHAEGAFTVSVTADPATLTLPADVRAEATGPGGARVAFAPPSAVDAFGHRVPVGCDHAPGATYALGSTTVTCTAAAGTVEQARGSFVVTVVDTTPPALRLPGAITVPAAGPAGAVVRFAATAHDLVAGDVPVTCAPASGTTFAVGTTTVTCAAGDGGRTATARFAVTVAAYVPPAAPVAVPPATPVAVLVAGPVATLPFTGFDAGRATGVAGALLVGGAGLVLAGRRRAH